MHFHNAATTFVHLTLWRIPEIRLQPLIRDRIGDAKSDRNGADGFLLLNIIICTYTNSCILADKVFCLPLQCYEVSLAIRCSRTSIRD